MLASLHCLMLWLLYFGSLHYKTTVCEGLYYFAGTDVSIISP